MTALAASRMRLRRAVVLLEHDDGDVGERVLELEDVADVGAAEPVDRLVAVADDADVAVRLAEQEDELVLDRVGVLVLVDEHVLEALLVVLEHVGVALEELDGVAEQVVEVHGPGPQQAGLVLAVDVGDLALEDDLRRGRRTGRPTARRSWPRRWWRAPTGAGTAWGRGRGRGCT